MIDIYRTSTLSQDPVLVYVKISVYSTQFLLLVAVVVSLPRLAYTETAGN